MRIKAAFLGTPQVVVPVLEVLSQMEQEIQIRVVITQPPARSSRSSKLLATPVDQKAQELGIPVLTPENVNDAETLNTLRALGVQLCITAAFGQVLSQEFLDLPKFGTLNIHPSLLPAWRGASPVQRALEQGVKQTGVSLALTVKAMDAGPILGQCKVDVDETIKAPQLLEDLFKCGARLMQDLLPAYLGGRLLPRPQDPNGVTKAKKLSPEESWLSPAQTAWENHNKVRAFSGWPGTRIRLQLGENLEDQVELKVHTTCASASSVDSTPTTPSSRVAFDGEALVLECLGGTKLRLLEVQVLGKKVVGSVDFWNGLKTRKLDWIQNRTML